MRYFKPLKFLFLFAFLIFGVCTAQTENEPPKIYAEGDQFYCPLSEIKIVTSFNIVDPDDTEIEEFFIQISTGYVFGQDQLKLLPGQDNITSFWNAGSGKLTLKSKNGGLVSYEDLISAVKEVVFLSNNQNTSGEKFFSFTIGDANFLPSTGHYYEYIEATGIVWTQAKDEAEARTYNGLKGYLATIRSSDEAKLSGEQADGTGWIGGSDAEVEGEWKWMTGPDVGIVFWNGLVDGSAPNGEFSFWNTGEPNNLNDEDYAHVTSPNIGIRGSWNDLSNTGANSGEYQPKGYIVEYGDKGPGEAEDFAAYTRVYTTTIESIISGSNCGPGEVLLKARATAIDTLPKPVVIQWFISEESNSPIHIGETYEPDLSITTDFFVLASDEGCTSGKRTMITASIYEIPDIEQSVTLQNCDVDDIPNDGYTDFNLEEANELIDKGDATLSISYYLTLDDATTAVNPVNPSPFNNQIADKVFARAENINGCFETAEVNLVVSSTDPVDLVILETCDLDDENDGKHTFDLTEATILILASLPPQNLKVQYYRTLNDATLKENEILPQTDYKNETPYFQTLFVRIESEENGDCMHLGEYLELYVFPLPEFRVNPEEIYCQNLEPIVLNVIDALGDYSYIWKDPTGQVISTDASVSISSGGTYNVVASSDVNCQSTTRTVKVTESIIASVSQDDIEVIDGGEHNSISINTTHLGIGDYEYALDNAFGPYQDEPFFDDVYPGIHTVYIRDKNNCGIANINVSVIGYPNFFTPNGDGINDNWQVQGVLFQPKSNIYIYDKFGKLLEQIDAVGEGWNGVYRGKLMPSTDYWYMVQLDDGRVHRGHFSLIRR